ncbi:MAG: triose-phosphate isomerase [Myxococcota bacterium]
MSRLPLVVANWKLHHTPNEAEVFAGAFKTLLASATSAAPDAIGTRFEVAIAPASPALDRLGNALADSGIGLAAQNLHPEPSGAFTGEVSLGMLEELGCAFALIGHSERRQIFGEDDRFIAAKAERLVGSPVAPILCVGETLEERESEATLEIVRRQLETALEATGDGLAAHLVVAYEPVWAIGTGRTATPELAQEVHSAIRSMLVDHYGKAGENTRILYGGSVKPSNASELLAQPDIDGALVGGASLDPSDFAKIAACCL